MDDLTAELKAQAHRRGFALVGIAAATNADSFPQFEAWLDAGYAGTMHYLPNRREARRHPQAILPAVRSVVMLGYEYGGEAGPVARYARGPDYHDLLWSHGNALARWLQDQQAGAACQAVCDTAPLLERDFARRAGLGWIGKNTMLINKRRGSFFLLAALLTSVELIPDLPITQGHCGTCTACLDHCPTDAFVGPRVLDARRCISYLTIEHRGMIPLELRAKMGDHIWGCDVCQDVCPWNRHADHRTITFPHNADWHAFDLRELLTLSDAEYRKRFRGTVFFRAKRQGMLRNAAIVLGNIGTIADLELLAAVSQDADAIIAEAATWAIAEIQKRHGVAS
jgi:epoxyqueuosine reductase